LKATTSILFYLIWSVGSSVSGQQYYLRGEVKDESGNALQNVVILQPRTGYIYKSGTTGTFGITTNALIDTFQFSLTGYKPESSQFCPALQIAFAYQRDV
jgi:Ca-activated chloride channel family protein